MARKEKEKIRVCSSGFTKWHIHAIGIKTSSKFSHEENKMTQRLDRSVGELEVGVESNWTWRWNLDRKIEDIAEGRMFESHDSGDLKRLVDEVGGVLELARVVEIVEIREEP
jgi:hypothetical protein